jgi:hypothetical protein
MTKLDKIIKYASKVTTEERARNIISRNIKRRIILGDDNKYWIVNNADAQRLVNAGYEMI